MGRVIYFAENLTAAGVTTGTPVTKRAEFLAALVGVGSEGFESLTVGADGPFVLTFPGTSGDVTATLQSVDPEFPNDVEVRADQTGGGEFFGRWNTTPGGSKFIQASYDFEIVFSSPVSAFGFYGTDVGDFAAAMQVVLTDTNATTELLTVRAAEGQAPNGSLLFWGFIDSDKQYTKITFQIDQAEVDPGEFDVFGFDDMVIGDAGQIVAPPAPMQLAVTRGWGVNRHVLTVRMVPAPAPPAPAPSPA